MTNFSQLVIVFLYNAHKCYCFKNSVGKRNYHIGYRKIFTHLSRCIRISKDLMFSISVFAVNCSQ